MTEFITRNYGNKNFEIIIKTDSKEHYKATENFARWLIDHAKPTIEAKPIVHAHWFLLDDCANEGVYCSACTKKVYKTNYANQKLKSKYCPNCGAQMDEVAGDNNIGNKTENDEKEGNNGQAGRGDRTLQ